MLELLTYEACAPSPALSRLGVVGLAVARVELRQPELGIRLDLRARAVDVGARARGQLPHRERAVGAAEREPAAVGAPARAARRRQRVDRELAAAVEQLVDADALRELAEFVERKSIRVHFPVEYRYVQGDDIWLSPFFGRDSVAISVHQYPGMDFRPYFDGAEAIFRNHGGRPHWGKMHSLGATDLAGMYPHWNDFHALRRRLDPQGVFMNPYLQALFGD